MFPSIARVPSLLLALLVVAPAAPAAADDTSDEGRGPRLVTSAGVAWFAKSSQGRRSDASGAALELRVEGRPEPRVGYGVTLTWGLTDWDRAREWIDAGDRAGSWTTDQFAEVEAWVRRGEDDKTAALRAFGAVFADLFLAMTYVAVPACYAGSVGGATSHVQLDSTVSFHVGEGPTDAWVELGLGSAALPERFLQWRTAVGPVAGFGIKAGSVRVGARVLWSPPGLNSSSEGGTILTGALTASVTR